ncbi:MBL fold metallo-hydrolase [Flavobacterium sp. LS1R49]|uniref:MBL fold metallo-hydrolase n=1 Tax=Flavobacterium shii TaxID=2987687 RepID=A0A9X2ZE48_9FLAO|nr:MBL fold metallo-hydrolase [Flavobacterium shii]MCV9928102.1 MBL fold metallo-hydrolase [Flavobacterium shii]
MKKNNILLLIFLLLNVAAYQLKAQSIIQQPGYQRMWIGDFEVIAISDGTAIANAKEILNNDPRIPALLKKAFLPEKVESSINTFLIISADKRILVDAGAGDLMSPEGGMLLSSLKNAGYKPEDITDILITHLHSDHSGGLISKGKKVFPNATIHVNKKDLDFWKIHEQVNSNDNILITWNRPAFLALKPYITSGKLKTFEDKEILFPGIETYETAGHTSGHTAYRLKSGQQQLIFIGDLIHIEAIQLTAPEILDIYDFDKTKAAEQRKKVYNEFAKGEYLIAAAHISFPGVGHFRPEGKEYEWVPYNYSTTKKN